MDLCPELHLNEIASVSTEFCHHFLLGQSECAVAAFKILESLLQSENKSSSEVLSKCEDFISHSSYSNAACLHDELILRRNSVLISQIFKRDPDKKRRLIEDLDNQISLCNVNDLITDTNLLKAFHQCLQSITHQDVSTSALELLNLSDAGLSCIQNLLETEPLSAHRLVTRLVQPFIRSHPSCCLPLYELYVRALCSLCRQDSEDVLLLHTRFVQLILLFDPHDSSEFSEDNMAALFANTLTTFGSSENFATITSIYLSKRCRSLNCFPQFCDRQFFAIDCESTPIVANLNKDDHILLTQLCRSNQSDFWKLISFHSLRQSKQSSCQHFIESLLVLIYRLALSKDWTNLSAIVDKQFLCRLRPLLLILLWPLCERLEDASQLFAILNQENDNQSVLVDDLCRRIQRHYELVRTTIGVVSFDNQQPCDITSAFRSVGNQSKLRILCSVYNIGELDSTLVSSILEEKNSTPQLYSDCDVSLFRAFTALHLPMRAIRCFHPTSWRQNSSEDITFISKFNECLAADNIELAQQHYDASILSRLTRCADLIERIYPLSLRLEVIENLYSLVFCTNSIITTTGSNCSDVSSDENMPDVDLGFKTESPRDDAATHDADSSQARENFDPSRNQSSSWKTKPKKLDRVSFLCPSYLVRDLLLTCKSSLECLVSHIPTLSSNSGDQPITIERERALSAALDMPDVTALESRIGRLSDALSEALWRLSLFSPQLPRTLGTIFKSKLSSKNLTFKVRKAKTNRNRSNTGSSVSREGSEKDSTGQCNSNSKKIEAQLRQLHSYSRVRLNDGDIVRSMLSDPNSILAHCLLNDDYESAQNALKKLESSSRFSSLSGEVIFIHHFRQAQSRFEPSVNKINQNSIQLNDTLTSDSTIIDCNNDSPPTGNDSLSEDKHFGGATLSAIRKITISNKSHSQTDQIVDDLISMSAGHLPAPVLHLDSSNSSSVETHLHNAAIILDLGVSGASRLNDMKIILKKVQDRLASKSSSETIRVPLCDSNNNDLKPNHHRLSTILHVVSANLSRIRSFEQRHPMSSFQCMLLDVDNCDAEVISLSQYIHSINERILLQSQSRSSITIDTDSLMSGSCQPSLTNDRSSQEPKSSLSSNTSATPMNSVADSPSGSSRDGYDKSAMDTFTELIAALDSGEIKVFHNRTLLNNGQYFQYLESLSDHISLFSKFMKEQVNEDENNSKDSGTEVVSSLDDSQFLVVYDSPAKVVAKLLFEKGVDPLQLEKVCHGLGLSISHVILQACCPTISTKYVPDFQPNSSFPIGTIMANSGSQTSDLHESGQEMLTDCISQIMKVISDFSESTPNASKSPDNLIIYLTSNINIKKIFNDSIVHLSSIDLNCLKTLQQKMAFYLNLHNLMMVHLILHLRQLGVKEYSLNDFEFYMHRRRFCYSVGQLGPVSLYDVRTQLLKVRDNCSATKSGRKFEETRRISWVPSSDFYSLNTTSGNQMLLFGLIDGFISSVPLQTYTELNVVQELTSNLEFIIKRTLTKFSETNHVHLPEFLHLYSVVFTRSRSSNPPADTLSVASSSADTGHSSCDSDEDLLTFLISHCSSELQAEASVLQNREDKDGIVWTATHSTLGVSTSLLHFTYSDELQRTITNNGAPQTAPPLSASSPASSDRFAMTDSALDFIFESSPLLATLLLLVVGDGVETRRETPVPMPLTDTGITGDNPPDKLQEEGPENIYSTMLNIRSYRYERLAREFLTLGQWIRCYWCRLKSSSSRSLSDPLMEFCSNLPPKSIILSLLSHPHSNEFHRALESHVLSLYQSGSWEDIFSTIKSLPRIVTNATPAPAIIRPIRDFALRQLLLNMSEFNADSKKRLLWLFYLSESTDILNGDFLARCLPLLEARQALELLERCSATLKKIPERECKMSDILDHYIPRMRVYSEIADMIRSHDSPITRASSPYELIYWPKLEDVSESYPEFVLQQLLKWKAFPLASKWSAIFLPETGLQEIEAAYLESLVENDNVMNSVEFLQRLFHTLHNFPDGGPKFVWQVCVNIAQNFSNSSPLAVQLASGFALKHVLSLLEEGRPPESGLLLSRAFVGASMLRALPSFTIRDMYQHLMLTPHLIVEQLIMNLQIELCKQLLEQYRIQRGPVSLHYASDPQGDSFSEPTSPCPYSHSPGSIEYLPLSRIPELEPSAINQLLITYAKKAVKLGAVRLEEHDSSQLLRTEDLSLQTIRSNMLRRHSSFISEDETSDFTSTVCSPSADPLEATTTPNEEHFIMPRVPIPRENWVPDEQTNLCMCCRNERFSMFNRRHHCRQCGRVVCATCSENRHIINNMSSRVCKHCYIELTRLAAASPCPTMQSMKSATSDFLAPLRPRQATVIGFVDEGWRLSKEEEENEAIRQDFNFEQTPSITLCLSLLDLHSNSNDCGQSILELCDYLSSFLTPGKDNRPNPEVDYPLVISIIRHLLYKAKLKFSRVSNSDATLRCDVYLSQLDLLHVLIQSNYRKLPSLTQLTRKDQVGAFRDRLIQSERLELAMEVSTKAGLQCAPVWSAMALRSLESGDYAEARSYMKRCLSPLKDKNSFVPLQGPLNDVIKLLEGRRPSGVLISDILSFAEGLNNLLDEPEKRIRDDATMNRETLEECMFYLETYASHFHFLQFLVRHNYWNKAVTHARDMVSPDVFVESLVAPSLLMGKFKTLRDQMVMLDSSLRSWAPYMERICMHLEKNGYVEDLYNIQVLTHDHLRAAITCIYQFFLKGASTYVELNNRIAHLKTSSQHLENALKDALRSKDTTQSDKIRRYIKVVKMQEEGTRFLAQPACIKYMASAYAYKTKGLPTLFSEDGNSKVEFCLVIIFSSAVLLDGLTTACRIINECHMKAVPILSRAGYHLLSLMRANLPEAESSLRELVQEMRGLCYVMDSDDSDKIIFSILSRMTDAEKKGATAEEFIKRIVSKDTKINAYLLTNRFRPAYLLAVQLNNQQHIEKIAEEAEKSGDTQIAEICRKRIREMKASQSEM